MASISVTPEELRNQAANVETRRTNAEGEFSQLRSRLQGLTGCFTGAAQQAFTDRYSEWDGHAKGMLEALEGLGRFLKTAADTLEQTDQQLAQGISGS